MDQNAKTETPQSNGGDVEATIVLKKAISQEETPLPVNGEEKEVQVKSEEKQAPAATSAVDEAEVEVEEVEEVEESSSESEADEEVTTPQESEIKQKTEKVTDSQENIAPEVKESAIDDRKENEPVNGKTDAGTIVDAEKSEIKLDKETVKEEITESATKQVEDVVDNTAEQSATDSKQESAVPAKLPESAGGKNEVQEQVIIQERNQETVNNTIKEIISDIDTNIREQERVALLKQEELKLLKKQQELAQQIQEQQLLAQKLASQNDIMQQKYQQHQQQIQQQQKLQEEQFLKQQQQQQQPQQRQQFQQWVEPQHKNQLQRQDVQQFQTPQTTVTKYSNHEESRDGDTLTKRTESYETQESSNVSKRIDLQKIFTPATDAEEILPKNRKLYASSAFYAPGLHPTVEDQVELARRISHSLSDISNQQSKGQSMYVNRKKRSVKWVHEGQAVCGVPLTDEFNEEQHKENTEMTNTNESESIRTPLDKVPLRLLMNPRGQVRDYSSLRDSLNIETGLLSPEKCAELVTALQTHKGRGAELFAKRRKKSDKWVVDETTTSTYSPSGLPDYHPYQAAPPKPPTSPSILPAYSDAGKHRVQLNLHQEQLLEKYAKPGLKVVKSPWEAALESGSASTAFIEAVKPQHHLGTPTPSPSLQETGSGYQSIPIGIPQVSEQQQYQTYKPSSYNDHQRDLAYRPSLAQGWKAPSVSLPKDPEQIDPELEYEYKKSFGIQSQESENSSLSFCGTDQDYNLEIIGYNIGQLEQDSINTETQHLAQVPDSVNEVSQDLSANDEISGRIDVRRQLEQFEKQQQELALRKKHEENLQLKRYQNQRSWKWQQKPKTKNGENRENSQIDEVKEPTGTSIENNHEDEYIKVAVRDLIESFEQQAISEAQPDLKDSHFVPIGVQLASASYNDRNWADIEEKDLYVPKEIPLESYAPPPAVNIKPTATYSSYNQPQLQQQYTWAPATSPSATTSSPYEYNAMPSTEYHSSSVPGSNFPMASKPILKQDYATGNGHFPIASNVPPKQQYWEPTSYQKVPPSLGAQKPPQVNFNPSPLPYEKLAKFEGSNNDESQRQYSQPQQRYLAPNLNTKIRNTSPAPFGTRVAPQNPQQQQYFPCQGAPSLSRASPMPSSHFSADELLYAPSYNNAARGWHSSGAKASPFYTKPLAPLTSVGDIPYSDF